MDAQAYLMRHGWSGPGNPLNPNRRPGQHGGLGLTRPLLISRRENKIGIGKVPTKDPTNQWWLRGFEEALRGVGQTSTTGDGNDATNSLTRNGSQLYKFFVRGEVIPGTLRDKENNAALSVDKGLRDNKEKEKKRKRDRSEGGGMDDKQKEETKKRKRKIDEEAKSAKIYLAVKKAKRETKQKKAKKKKLSIEEADVKIDTSPSDTTDEPDLIPVKCGKRKKSYDEIKDKNDESYFCADSLKKKRKEKKESPPTENDHSSSAHEGSTEVKKRMKKEKKKSSRSGKDSKEGRKI